MEWLRGNPNGAEMSQMLLGETLEKLLKKI
jgi:hypothetical protein